MKRTKIFTIVFCLAAIFMLSGCGVNHKSPEGVVKSLVTYYEKGKEEKIKDCYGIEGEGDKDTLEEIRSTVEYFKAHGAKGVEFKECEIIQEYKTFAYVYVSYGLELAKDKAYPCLNTYMVRKKDKKYYILPTKEITEELSQQAKKAYTEFMKTDPYKDYQKSYEDFIKKNPNYENKLRSKLK